MTTMTPPV